MPIVQPIRMLDNETLSTQTLVRGQEIHVQHGRQKVLENVDLSVERNEIVTLIGPNGSGKTTLVRALLGLEKIQKGKVHRLKNIKLGYTPQTLAIDRTLPINVRRFLEMSGVTDQSKLRAMLDEVNVPDVWHREMRLLSGGELKRVLLARALLREPDFLALDEPMANVDVHGQIEFYDLIYRIRDDRGCGVLLVSHDLHMVMSATDRVVCLNGHICCSGSPGDVSRDPAYLELFGEAGTTVTVYSHKHDHHHA